MKSVNAVRTPLYLLLMLGGALLTACAPGPVRQEPVIERQPSPTLPAPSRPAPPVRSEVVPPVQVAAQLIEEARADSSSGQYPVALNKAERAQRLSPKSPQVYQLLGEIRQKEKRFAQAEQFFMKAISLAGKDRALLARLWHQVATVRAQNGDEAGARKAEEKASAY